VRERREEERRVAIAAAANATMRDRS